TQPRRVADPGIEREARGHVRRTRGAGDDLPLQDRGAVVGAPGRHDLAWRRLPEGVRRSDARLAPARAPRGAAEKHGHLPDLWPDPRRRVVVRLHAHRAWLEAVVLPRRV